MSTYSNPYAAEPAALAAADARGAFLQRTYSLLLLGVFCFAATLWAVAHVAAVHDLAIGLYRGGPLVCLLVLVGGGFAVRAVAHRHPINKIAYFAYTFLFGLLLSPFVLMAATVAPDALTQASIVTLLVFSGLTGYVFVTRADFSFLGAALSIAAFAMLGVIVAGMLFGFDPGLWFSVLGVLVFSGYVLYDTSRVLHHYPVNAHVAAAIELFVSLIMLFQYVLRLFMSNRD